MIRWIRETRDEWHFQTQRSSVLYELIFVLGWLRSLHRFELVEATTEMKEDGKVSISLSSQVAHLNKY